MGKQSVKSLRRTRKRLGAGHGRRDGTVLVEFALVVPVFILILFTCFEFCRLNMIRNLAQDAAYYATRHCIVPGATEKEAITEANRILNAMGTRNASITINGGKGIDENSNSVTVEISVPIADNALLASKFTNDVVLTSSTTMKTERYDGFYDPNK